MVPRLETVRLVLRGATRADFPAYAANAADPVATAFTGGTNIERTAWRLFCAQVGMWEVDGAGWWTLEERATGATIGCVGAFHREFAPDDLEVGWSIYQPYWRRGFGMEAARAAVEWARGRASGRIIAYVDEANVPSTRIIQKLGFQVEGPSDLYGTPVVLHVLPSDRTRV